MLLEGKVAVITGGARGIGREIGLTLAKEGADIVICDINMELAAKTQQEIESIGRRSLSVLTDVTNFSHAEETVNKTLDKFQKIDILINNAGITRDGLLLRMKEEDWDMVLSVNLKGTFNFTKAASKVMIKQHSGRIVNIASIIGIIGNAGQTNYAASKAGIIGFTKSAAKELAGRGINVNAIAPGFIDTEMTAKLPEDVRQKMLAQIPRGRFGQPLDVAKAVLFLVSDFSDYITGQVIQVDGGMVM